MPHLSIAPYQFDRADLIEAQRAASEAAAPRSRDADARIRERAEIQRQDIIRSEEIERLRDQQLADSDDRRDLSRGSLLDISA